ncbi:MAG: hypothetical protein OEY14_01390 [Myxococcales bacterium]|nr:hypothetical protein [Myxococcales bacterium]
MSPARSSRGAWAGAPMRGFLHLGALLAGGLLLGALGCGASPAQGAETARGSIEAEGVPPEVREIGGLRLLAMPRAGSTLHLSLWIDAGSRDADPPQIAALAAADAARFAGAAAAQPAQTQGAIEVEVTPDGTHFSTRCAPEALPSCLRRLGGLFRADPPDEARLDEAFRWLLGRRRAAAADEGRSADALALSALLGDHVLPLGEARRDEEIDASALATFRRAHYGGDRALLVGIGPIAPDRLEAAVAEALSELPRGAALRAERPPLEPSETELAAEVGERNRLTLALAIPELDEARAIANALMDPIDGLRPEAGATGARSFALRGVGVVLVRAEGVPALEPSARALLRGALLAIEGGGAGRLGTARGAGDSAAEQAARLGLRWVAGLGLAPAPAPASHPLRPIADASLGPRAYRIALGAFAAGGRADSLEAEDPDTAQRIETLRLLRRAARWAEASVEPPITGEVEGAGATLPNGVRLRLRRLGGHGRISIVVGLEGGIAEEPARAHGRTGLLAAHLARSCGARGEGRGRARLDALEATLGSFVEDGRFGIWIEARREGWQAALDLALSCIERAELDREDLEQLRIEALDRIRRGAEEPEWSASLLAPARPSLIASQGSVQGIAGIRLPLAREALSRSRWGKRVIVAVAGDVPAASFLRRAGARLSSLEPGEPAPEARLGSAGPPLLSASIEGGRPRALIAFRTEAPSRGGRARAAALARAWAETLEGPETRIVWRGSGAGAWGAFCAVSLELPEEALPSLPQRIEAARARVRRSLDARVGRSQEGGDAEPPAMGSRAAAWALLEALDPAPGASTEGASDELLRAPPRLLVARPAAAADPSH